MRLFYRSAVSFILVFFSIPVVQSKLKNDLAITGYCDPHYTEFDRGMLKFLHKRGFKAATLVVTFNDKVVVERGYGWKNKSLTEPLMPQTSMRIASLTKMFTAAAIRKLIDEKKLSLTTNMTSLLKQFNTFKDSRVRSITIQHLLEHKAGWDLSTSFDPLFRLDKVSQKLNKAVKDLEPSDVIRYILEYQSLDFAPGTRTEYSNVGYLILGQIIEKVTGQSYFEYIQKVLCEPRGILVYQGNKPIKNEIKWYEAPYPNPEEIFTFKTGSSAFGLVASTLDIVTFLAFYSVTGTAKKSKDALKSGWVHGGLSGTTAFAAQRYSGARIAVLINSRDDNNEYSDDEVLKNVLYNIANRCGI
jgi:CubicO group peptidase (beta-lactamase class C family)